MNKPLPPMKTDQEIEQFLEQDLSDYLTKDNFSLTTFEFAPENKSVTISMPSELMEATKKAAQTKGVSCQRYIREAIEQALVNP